LCQGTAQVLSGTATVTAASINGGFTYSWRKVTPTPVTVLVAPTTTALTINTATAVPNYSGITGVLTDSGKYVLRVEDGNTGNSSCYTEASVIIKINPTPTITSAATGTVCSGIAQNYTITSSVPSSYAWTRAVVAGISNAAGSGAASPITETLTNTTTAAVAVVYKITPTSTTGSCVGPVFTYTVTVNPTPTITSAATGTICSGVAQSYGITSSVPSSYAWTRAVVAGISNAAGSGTTTPITESLTNTTTAAVAVAYIITPTSTTGSCAGPAFTYTVTVNPKPTITSAATGTICSGVAQSYGITSSVPSSYAWTRAVVAGISNAAGSGAASPITETLTNTTTAAIAVPYTITPTSTTGSCAGTPFTYTVTVNPTPTISSAATGSVCSGVAQNYTITSVVPSNYAWTRAVVTGISNAAGSGAASPITETLTNTTTAAVAVAYIITPTSTAGTCAGPAFTYTVTVNPKPTISSAATGTICSGAAQSYTITSVVPSSYAWTRAVVTGISNAAGSGAASPITETLTNTTTAAVAVAYTITPTSTTGSCAGTPFTYTVTVNPTPTISSAATGSVCSGVAQSYTITSAVASSYSWSRAAVTGISNAAVTAQSANPIAETLTNTTAAAVAVPYIITPTSTTGSCAGPAFTYTVTVNPKPTITSAAAGAICSGVAQSYGITSSVPSSYAWTRAAVTGISNAAGSGSTTPITETLTNTTAAAVAVPYIITPTSTTGSCAGVPFTYTVTVNPAPVPSVTASTPSTTVCANTSITFTATPTNGGTTPTYQWSKNGTAIAGATNATYTTTTEVNNDSYTVTLTSNAACVSPATATSTAVVITVTTVVTPAVSITAAPAGAICAGKSVTFTANPGNGGTAPTYQWYNGATAIAGQTNITYTSTSLANGDAISVKMVSNSGCASTPNATSNTITMSVTANVTPSVTASVSPNTAICPGASITFTATPTNGGTAPTYQWNKGGTAIAGATNATYTTTSAANNDSYTVTLTSNVTCVTTPGATSSAVVISVNPTLVPSVTVSGSPATVCTGQSVTFTATPTNPGTTPSYQWMINLTNVGSATTSTTFTTTALLASTDSVRVVLTSNALCASPTTVTSKGVKTTILAGIGAGSIGSDQTICYNTAAASITELTAASGVTGAATYSWESSATGAAPWTVIAGATGKTLSSASLLTSDLYVHRIVTDGTLPAPCNTATSNTVHITVNPQLVAGTISGNETVCANAATATITNVTSPTGGTGIYTYTWDSLGTSGTWTSIAGATNATYSPGALSSSRQYRRNETSCGTVTSNTVTKTINPILVPSVTVSGSPGTVCKNQTVTFTATPTNPGTTPSYQWMINGSNSGSATTSTTFVTTALVASTDQVSVSLTSNALCANPTTVTSAGVTTTVLAGIGAGTIGSDQTICYNTAAATITELTAASGVTGAATYSWEASADGIGGWTVIPGATGTTLSTGVPLTADVYVHRIVSDATLPAPCNIATSNVVHIKVNPALVKGSISGDETLCANTTAGSITSTSLPTGGDGTYTYSWISSTDNGVSWTVVSGATGTTYSPGTLTTSTQYRRVEKSGSGCGADTSNTASKTVTPISAVSVTINDPGQSCSGQPVNFTASPLNGGTAPTYQWYVNNVAVAGQTASTFSSSSLTNGQTINVVLSSNVSCPSGNPASSNVVTANIVTNLVPAVTIAAPAAVCAGTPTTHTILTSSGGGPTPTYQWYLNTTLVAGQTGTTYTGTFSNGDQIYVIMTTSSSCATAPTGTSNTVTMVVKPVPAPMINEPSQIICTPNSFTFTSTVGAGDQYQWSSGGTAIAGATNSSITLNQSGVYTITENNGTCSITSAPVTLTVIPTPVANAGSDIFIKQGDPGALNGSGGANYSWSPVTGLSNPLTSNPSFIANQTTTYTLTVSDPTNTCSSTATVTVYVERPIKIPNVVTVNGDGNNDTWEIVNIQSFPNATFEIYNRWGNLVWKSTGYPKEWDGTNFRNGEVLPDGTYFYIIDLHSHIYTEPYTGYVQIIR